MFSYVIITEIIITTVTHIKLTGHPTYVYISRILCLTGTILELNVHICITTCTCIKIITAVYCIFPLIPSGHQVLLCPCTHSGGIV